MIKRLYLCATISTLLFAGAAGAQQFPMMNIVADRIIERYQKSSCEQLWQKKGKRKTDEEKNAIQMLRDDPQMRAAFIDKIAAPIANKMFECGMLP